MSVNKPRVRVSLAHAQQVINEYQGSGLTKKDYCTFKGLPPGTLHRYAIRLERAGKPNQVLATNNSSGFVELRPEDSCHNTGEGLSLYFNKNDCEIHLSENINQIQLQAVVEVLNRCSR